MRDFFEGSMPIFFVWAHLTKFSYAFVALFLGHILKFLGSLLLFCGISLLYDNLFWMAHLKDFFEMFLYGTFQ